MSGSYNDYQQACGERWQNNFALLKEYVTEFGILPVTRTVYKDVKLGQWVHNQKTMFRNGRLSSERIELFRCIGVGFENELDRNWQNNFVLLQEYVAEFGRLPTVRTVYKSVNLRQWVTVQKGAFNKGKLSPEREELLRSVGVGFENELDRKWQNAFEALQEYITEFNRLPTRNVVWKGIKLGRWVNTQKTALTNGTLSSEREALLSEIGIIPEGTRDQKWHRNLALLKEYIAEFGIFPVTRTVYKDVKLGLWVTVQKNAFNKGKLSPEREELLCSVGVTFESNQVALDRQWNSNFALLKEYIAEFGIFPVATTVYKDVKLGLWVTVQKNAFNKGKLSPEREELLRSVGVTFESNQVAPDRQWNSNFALLKEYIAEFGIFPVATTVYKDVKLGQWVTVQKSAFNKGKLSPEREELLRSVGVSFEIKFRHNWQNVFEVLQEYIAEFNRLPTQSVVWKGITLGRWVNNQKIALTKGTLSSERETLLSEVWITPEDTRDRQWNSNFALLKEYIEKFSRLPTYQTVYGNVRLGSWVGSQKTAFKNGKLSQKRETLLRDLGVILGPPEVVYEQQWEVFFARLQEYVDDFSKFPPKGMLYKGLDLGNWFAFQEVSIQRNTLYNKEEAQHRLLSAFIDKMHEKQWQDNFALLQLHINEFGEMPQMNTFSDGVKLGHWFYNQKAALKQGMLSAEHEAQLQSVEALLEDVQNRRWVPFSELLQEYVAVFGALPTSHIVYQNVKLGKWFKEQQTALKRGDLSPEREAFLHKVISDAKSTNRTGKRCTPFIEKQARDIYWVSFFALLQVYVAEFGRMPEKGARYKELELGNWLAMQEALARNNMLSAEQAEMLRNAGVELCDSDSNEAKE